MRRAAKRDDTERAIVDHLRSLGYSVMQISGPGLPDLAVGRAGKTHLLEVKSPGGRPTSAQRETMRSWSGSPIWTVRSPAEAYEAVNTLAAVVEEPATSAWEEAHQQQSRARPVLSAGQDTESSGG